MRRVVASMAFLLVGAAPPAHSAVVVTASEVAGGMVFTGSGTLDLTAWSLFFEDSPPGIGGSVDPNFQLFIGAPALSDTYDSPLNFSGPPLIGFLTLRTFATSDSGDFFGLIFGYEKFMSVPANYSSGGALSATSTFAGETIASLGLTRGTYVWTWGSGASADSLTLDVGAPVPSLGPFGLTALTLALLLAGTWWIASDGASRQPSRK